jgi:outer membrane protein OmpA-like peptidoglycan-associated protein
MALIGFALLGAATLAISIPRIEGELRNRSAEALRGFDWVTVDLDGRILVLSGTAPDKQAHQRMQGAAHRIEGVFRVDDLTRVEAVSEASVVPTESPVAAVEPALETEDSPSGRESGAAPEALDASVPASGDAVEAHADTAESTSLSDVSAPVDSPADVSLIASAAACQARLDAVLKAETIRFESGSREFFWYSRALLKDVANIGKSCDAFIEVAGYTDDLGDETENRSLSRDRAQAVVDFLVQEGMDARRLSAVGHGEEFPVAPNTTWAGRKSNRRIEFKALATPPAATGTNAEVQP